MAYETRTISIGQLLLDAENPRHDLVTSQREALNALIENQRQKLVVLANDILEFGLSPIDRLLVIKSGRNYTVVEGNRRLAVLKILNNPVLAEGTPIETPMKRLSAKASSIPSTVECAIAPARKDAEHWMENRHGGESQGAGVVPWNALATNRFSQKPGREAGAAIKFLQAVEDAYPKSPNLFDLIQAAAKKRLTSLGRLVLDQNFKARIGMEEINGSLVFHFSSAELEDFFERVIADFAADVGVSEVRNKQLRVEYLATTPEPDPKKRRTEAAPLTSQPAPQPKPKPKPKPKPATKPPKPFRDLNLSGLDSKTQTLLREFRELKIEKTPHAAAVLLRCILELSVDGYIDAKGLSRGSELHQRVKKCLGKLDPKHENQQFKAVRTGLTDGESFYSIRTLHAFVHNKFFLADATTLGNIAANMEPFLQALNDDV